MSTNSRFHSKFHRRNHHTTASTGYPDSATDPIASETEPFKGSFVLNGQLSSNNNITNRGTIRNIGNLYTHNSLSASDTYALSSVVKGFLSAGGTIYNHGDIRNVGGNIYTTGALSADNIFTNILVATSARITVMDLISYELTGFDTTGNVNLTGDFVATNLVSARTIYSKAYNSDNWDSNFVTSNSNSARWESVYTTTNSKSARWESVYTITNSNSARWESVYTVTNSNSARWESGYTVVNSNSAKWESSYSTTNSNSAKWESSYSTTNSNSAKWESSYSTTNASSAEWTSARTTVSANSANWTKIHLGPFILRTSTALVGNSAYSFRVPTALTLTNARASLSAAGATGNNITVDVVNQTTGQTVFSSPNHLKIFANSKTSSAVTPTFSADTIADDTELRFDVLSGNTGQLLQVWLIGTMT